MRILPVKCECGESYQIIVEDGVEIKEIPCRKCEKIMSVKQAIEKATADWG